MKPQLINCWNIMTPAQRNDLRDKAMAATPGSWVPRRLDKFGPGEHPYVQGPTMAINKRLCGSGMTVGFKSQHDAIYIASASPDVILALLDQVEFYEAALKSIATQDCPGVWGKEMSSHAQIALTKYQGHGG